VSELVRRVMGATRNDLVVTRLTTHLKHIKSGDPIHAIRFRLPDACAGREFD
jgi:hypothetical protein